MKIVVLNILSIPFVILAIIAVFVGITIKDILQVEWSKEWFLPSWIETFKGVIREIFKEN